MESLRAEISPVRRKASRFEQQLDVVRQESSAALLRATSEVTLRSQVGMPLDRPLDSAQGCEQSVRWQQCGPLAGLARRRPGRPHVGAAHLGIVGSLLWH